MSGLADVRPPPIGCQFIVAVPLCELGRLSPLTFGDGMSLRGDLVEHSL